AHSGCTFTSLLGADPYFSYLLIPTDGEGNIQFKNVNVGRTFTVHLEAYILGVTFPRLELFDGVAPTGGVWQDLDTPFGQGFAYLRAYHNADAGNVNIRCRGNNEAFFPSRGASTLIGSLNPAVGEIGYCFIPLDVYGTAEWDAEIAGGMRIRAEALTK
ncbi:unnamed protein product, partial [marine sediment metagenome]